MKEATRWWQRFDNYNKAFGELKESVELSRSRKLSKLEKHGLIQGFEYTHELAWNVLKDYLTEQGLMGLIASKDSTREAFKRGLIANGESWMEMIKARNITSHAYDESLAEKIFQSIVRDFYPELEAFTQKFAALSLKDQA